MIKYREKNLVKRPSVIYHTFDEKKVVTKGRRKK